MRELNLKVYRQQLGCVQQEPVVFEGTISENIRLGKLEATDDEVIRAAQLANVHNFVLKFPQVCVHTALHAFTVNSFHFSFTH